MENTLSHNEQTNNIPFYLLILAMTFSYYYINIGFALKPYMIISIIIFFAMHRSIIIHRFKAFELFMMIFLFYYSFTGIFAKYPAYSLRMILGIILIMFCYLVIRYILSLASINGIERGLLFGGLVFNILSILLYLIGLIKLNFNFDSNGVVQYGVVTDRGLPRLIGLAKDPNIFSYYNILFFFFYITHMNKRWAKLGLVVTTITIILSISRGGILAIFVGLSLMFLVADIREKLRYMILVPLTIIILNILFKLILNINIFNMIITRFFTLDGGSGRDLLWKNSLEFFRQSPILGIGIFNYQPYSENAFGYPAHMHNTFMDALVEAGLIGLTLFMIMLSVPIITYYVNRKYMNDNGYLLYSLLAMIFFMTTYSLIANEIIYVLFALMWRYLHETKYYKDPKHL